MKQGINTVNLWWMLLLFFLGTACEEDGDQQCVIREALITYEGSGRVESYLKELYTFDGTHYSRIEGFRYDQANAIFPEVPDYVIYFSYEADRLVKMRTENRDSPGHANEFLFSYTTNEDVTIVTQVYRTLENEVVTFENMQVRQRVETPGDQSVVLKNELGEDVLYVFEAGNLVRVAFESVDGNFELFGKKWRVGLIYRYDNRPNPLASLPLRFHLARTYVSVPNAGFCVNNVLEEEFPNPGAPIVKEYSYEWSQGLLQRWVYESTGRTVTFKYDCR